MATITITAKITLDYDTEEGLVSTPQEAAADLWGALAARSFMPDDYVFSLVNEDGTETPVDPY